MSGAEAAEAVPFPESSADLKIILLGDSAVGKSKLVERFLLDDYKPFQLSTYALTVFRHEMKFSGASAPVVIEFWDTAGQERFASMHPSYYHRAHACVMVFDVTRKETYTNLAGWYRELQTYRKGIPILVVANKVDCNPRAASKPFQFTDKRGLPKVRFCSASDGTNVVQTFTDIVKMALLKKREGSIGKAGPAAEIDLDALAVDGVDMSAFAAPGSATAAVTGAGAAGHRMSTVGDDEQDFLDEVMATLEYFETKDGPVAATAADDE